MQTNPPPTGPTSGALNPNQINNINNATGTIKDMQAAIENAFNSLTTRTEGLERLYTETNARIARTFGTTQQAIVGLRQELAIATPEIVALGGKAEDVATIQEEIAKSLNTNVITLGETVSDLFAAGKAVGLTAAESGQMVASFQNAGIQTEFIKDNMQETVDIARNVGVNTSAVFGLVNSNLENINRYGFTNGVQGLSRMAAQAAGLRINMNEIFGFAERVFNPEGAIEMVASFQRLGVAAGDLADPFRLMYLASEDTEELQNQVVKMTEKFTYFDETTKEFKVLPNAKRDMREIAKETGIAYEELVKMSIGTQKLNMIGKDFKIAGLSEEDKMLVANLATYSKEKGGFSVKVGREEKLVSELSQEDIEKISAQPATLEDIAEAQLTESELQTALLQTLVDRIASVGAGGRAAADTREVLRATIAAGRQAESAALGNQRRGIEEFDKFYQETGKSLTDLISGEGGFTQVSEVFKRAGVNFETSLSQISSAIGNVDYSGVASKYISSGNKIAEGASAAFDKIIDVSQKASAKIEELFDVKLPSVTSATSVQPTKVEFGDLTYTGNLNINLTTPTGTFSNPADMDKLTYDLFNNETYRKSLQSMMGEFAKQANYSTLPNSATA